MSLCGRRYLVLQSTTFPYSSPMVPVLTPVQWFQLGFTMRDMQNKIKQNNVLIWRSHLFGPRQPSSLSFKGWNFFKLHKTCISGCLMALIIIMTIIFCSYWLDKKLRQIQLTVWSGWRLEYFFGSEICVHKEKCYNSTNNNPSSCKPKCELH